MVGTIICEVSTIICDIGIINVRFYLFEVRYPHGYCKITPIRCDVGTRYHNCDEGTIICEVNKGIK